MTKQATGVALFGERANDRTSFGRLAVADGLLGFAIICGLSLLVGLGGTQREVLVLSAALLGSGTAAVAGRRRYERRGDPSTYLVVSALAATWMALVLSGTAVYLLTGTVTSPANALFESAAGFSTVAATTLDVTALSPTMSVFRAATQFLGGLLGLIAAVVSLPRVMKTTLQVPSGEGLRRDRLVPAPLLGRRRIMAIYSVLTLLCALAYASTGFGIRSALIHGMTTVSTGGFSDRASSFMDAGVGAKLVATVFMFVAGMSYFALFWLIRGKTAKFVRSIEWRVYLAIVSSSSLAIFFGTESTGFVDSVFTATSASSTTGFAVVEWPAFSSFGLAVLLFGVATGAMSASSGSGLRVIRAFLLVRFALREIRLQLDPKAVTVIRYDDRALADRELDSLTGYQIAHFGLVGVGAFVLATTGDDLVDALWTSVSMISTFGPSPTMGPMGDANQLSEAGRLLMIPGMLAGRLTVLPLLFAVAAALAGFRGARRRIRSRLRDWGRR